MAVKYYRSSPSFYRASTWARKEGFAYYYMMEKISTIVLTVEIFRLFGF